MLLYVSPVYMCIGVLFAAHVPFRMETRAVSKRLWFVFTISAYANMDREYSPFILLIQEKYFVHRTFVELLWHTKESNQTHQKNKKKDNIHILQ